MSRLAVGFLGCGLIGRSHAQGLVRAGGAEIVAVHDPDRDRAERFAAEFCRSGPAAVLDGPGEVIAAVDAVYVCTWTSAHPELVAAAAEAGRAVFCEKPLAVSLDQAEAMTVVVAAAGVTNQVGLVLRHSPAFRWLRATINRPELGPIMNVVFRDDQYIPTQGLYQSTWRGNVDLAGGGTLLEHSIHDLDLLEWLMGPIADVSARTGSVHRIDGIEDQASVRLVSSAGAQASLISVWHDVLSRPSQRRVEVFALKGYFSLEGDWNGPVTWDTAETELGPATSGSLDGRALHDVAASLDGLGQNPDADFVAAVEADTTAYPSFSTALRAHRLADAAYRSAAAGGATIATPVVAEQPRR